MKTMISALLYVISISLSNLNCAEDYLMKTGSVITRLPADWIELKQPKNFFIQERAHNTDRTIYLSGGSFIVNLTIQQYVSAGIAGYMDGIDAVFKRFEKQIGITKEQVSAIVESRIGKQLIEATKKSLNGMKVNLISVDKISLNNSELYEIRSSLENSDGNIVYCRQFVLSGSNLNEIIQLTYASGSEEFYNFEYLFSGIMKN